MKIAILSNVNVDLLSQTLSKDYDLYQQEGYGQWVQEAINPSESLREFRPQAIFLLLDGRALLEGINDTGEAEQEICTAIRHCENLALLFPATSIFVSNLDIAARSIISGDTIRPEHHLMDFWEKELEQIIGNNSNIHLFDLRSLAEGFGRQNFYSDKMWYMGSIPYSMKGFTALANAMKVKISCHGSIRKKVLVLDLDNTLWGGVLGEDGFDGITLSRSLIGAAYRDAQLRIKELADMGILLAISSKNDENDVIHVLNNHPQMVLREEDFVAICANWEGKAQNIAELANRLNLGIDSFVFLDDNPVEREAMRIALPDMTVVDFPKDISNLPSTIEKMAVDYFFAARLTKEDSSKTLQYKQEVKRQAALSNTTSIEDYLVSLQIDVILEEMKDTQLQRVSQLTQKTNQFNLLTNRFSTEQLIEYAKNDSNHVYVATVSDRYGDSGLVFVLMVSKNGHKAQIDNLLMSCRVMGRHIEDAVIAAVEDKLKEEGVTEVVASYIPTVKNKPVENLLDRLDFQLINKEENGEKNYIRYLDEQSCKRKVLFNARWSDMYESSSHWICS